MRLIIKAPYGAFKRTGPAGAPKGGGIGPRACTKAAAVRLCGGPGRKAGSSAQLPTNGKQDLLTMADHSNDIILTQLNNKSIVFLSQTGRTNM